MYLNPENETVRKRQAMEVAIVKRIVTDALKAGYTLSVDDGGDEYAVTRSTSRKAVLDALINTDEDVLHLERRIVGLEREHGWVRLVYGNDGWDVINDYSGAEHIEAVLAGANALAEKLEERS
ncbi:MAG TPA: hypothetical protein VNW90_19135 [Acetobacteraceae bacterium]|jgi:hypothetical protein|nr:hypothetical protein [Acetobacteraceae bacterium]